MMKSRATLLSPQLPGIFLPSSVSFASRESDSSSCPEPHLIYYHFCFESAYSDDALYNPNSVSIGMNQSPARYPHSLPRRDRFQPRNASITVTLDSNRQGPVCLATWSGLLLRALPRQPRDNRRRFRLSKISPGSRCCPRRPLCSPVARSSH